MVERMARSLARRMIETGLIEENMAGSYIYVAVCLIERFITIGTIILISIIIGRFFPTILFLCFFLGLRKRTGGFHLNKFYQCYIATVASYLLVAVVSEKMAGHQACILVMLFLSSAIICVIGTVNHPNMHMNSEELAVSKKMAKITVMLEGCVICFSILIGADTILISYMAIAVALCAALLCIAKIIKQEVRAK